MIASTKSLHRALVDTDVFAAIWRERRPGEENENDVLRRIYRLDGRTGAQPASNPDVAIKHSGSAVTTLASGTPDTVHRSPISSKRQILHREANIDFPEAFEIFRGLNDRQYRAFVAEGGWRLDSDGKVYPSLAALNQAIGAGHQENPWMGWLFKNSKGKRRPLDEYRLGKT